MLQRQGDSFLYPEEGFHLQAVKAEKKWEQRQWLLTDIGGEMLKEVVDVGMGLL